MCFAKKGMTRMAQDHKVFQFELLSYGFNIIDDTVEGIILKAIQIRLE